MVKLVNQNSKIDSFKKYHLNYNNLLNRVEDAISFSIDHGSFKTLFFCNENEQKIVTEFCRFYKSISCYFLSKIIDSQSKLLIISSLNYSFDDFYDETTVYKVKYASKFITIKHSDVLGTILNLNIDSCYIGDIVCNDYIYLEIKTNISNYLKLNVDRISNTRVSLIESKDIIYNVQEYKDILVRVKSLRLDCIIKGITNMSRSDTKEYILAGNVKVDQILEKNYSKLITNDIIISLRKYGRYHLLISDIYITAKGNYHLVCKQYI